eukprot:jgi/Mesen1/2637/ME000166S01754
MRCSRGRKSPQRRQMWLSNGEGSLYVILAFLVLVVVGIAAENTTDATSFRGTRENYRINCGGPSFTDKFGRYWYADNGTYSLGDARMYATARIFTAADAAGGQARPGYAFPVRRHGRYLLRLYFAAAAYNLSGFAIALASFSVTLNGGTILRSYSPLQDAGGLDSAVIHEYILPVLNATTATLLFQPGGAGYATVNGIELISTLLKNQSADPTDAAAYSPGIYGPLAAPSVMLETVHRVNCGGPRVPPNQDRLFRTWAADYAYSLPSYEAATNHTIKGTDGSPSWLPPEVYRSQRVAMPGAGISSLAYSFVVQPGSDLVAAEGASERRFDALINYNPVLWDFSISQAAGKPYSAIFEDFLFTTPILVPQIAVVFTPSLSSILSRGAAIAGLEILRIVDFHAPSEGGNSSLGYSASSPAGSPGPAPAPGGGLGWRAGSGAGVPAGAPFPFPQPTAGEILLGFKAALGNPASLADWRGSPCTGATLWTGVGCAGTAVQALVLPNMGLTGIVPPELGFLSSLVNLWLNGNRLTGPIPAQLGRLQRLYSLRLHNNSFTGGVPESFASLASLHELTLDHNNLTGPVPEPVLDLPTLSNQGDNIAVARFLPGNNGLCAPSSAVDTINLPLCALTPSPNGAAPPDEGEGLVDSAAGGAAKKSMMVGVIVGVVGGVLLLACCLMVGYFFGVYRRKEHARLENRSWDPDAEEAQAGASKGASKGSTSSRMWPLRSQPSYKLARQVNALGLSAGRVFTLAELRRATKDFSESALLGSGGFGRVYRGELLDGTRVAVKRHIAGSGQGSHQFFMELEVLSKVRHRHLVSLIGYCQERSEMILVYEHMPRGTLREHICAESTHAVLSWRKRLEIAIGAAKGVEYLHHGLEPPIIHRDLKSTNILLDQDYAAKVGDFGLSRNGPRPDETHVSTAVRGSFGYVDPEYYKWLKLTDKSDVYSFGVVLLEIVAGRKVIDLSLPYETNQVNLVEWSRPYLQSRTTFKIADHRLGGSYSHVSLQKVGDLVQACLQEPGKLRPSMVEVLRELEAALRLETLEVAMPIPDLLSSCRSAGHPALVLPPYLLPWL